MGAMRISCGKWKCKDCRPAKAKQLLARAIRGMIARTARVVCDRERYNFKTLTLTYGGREMRARYTREEAAVQMRDAFRKLIRFLRKHLGHFDYIRVTEDQQDGYPHYHVLIAGRGIAPRYVLRMIEDAWRAEYGMGFVKLHKIYDVERAIKYVLKYLFKEPAIYDELRLFSSSRGSLQPKTPSEYEWTHLKYVFGCYRGTIFVGACFQGAFMKSTDGRKVVIHGKCTRHDLWELEACFDSVDGLMKWEESKGERRFPGYRREMESALAISRAREALFGTPF